MSGSKDKFEEEYIVTVRAAQIDLTDALATPLPGSAQDQSVRLHQHVIEYLADLMIEVVVPAEKVPE